MATNCLPDWIQASTRFSIRLALHGLKRLSASLLKRVPNCQWAVPGTFPGTRPLKRRSDRPPVNWLLAIGCLLAITAVVAATGCDSGSNSVPASASQEQLDQVKKAQENAASEEMNRPPSN